MTNTPDKSELLPCRECGAPCSPELFPVHCGEPCDTTIWMCSQHRFLGGKCSSETAYLTKTAWNTRASSRPADQVPDMVERVARALSIPQYHTGWDDLPETDKDLFYMQADYAIAALQAVPAMGEVGEIRDLLVAAYRTGAKDVHDFLAKLPDDERQMVLRDDRPDLTEAAHSYADAAPKASKGTEE